MIWDPLGLSELDDEPVLLPVPEMTWDRFAGLSLYRSVRVDLEHAVRHAVQTVSEAKPMASAESVACPRPPSTPMLENALCCTGR